VRIHPVGASGDQANKQQRADPTNSYPCCVRASKLRQLVLPGSTANSSRARGSLWTLALVATFAKRSKRGSIILLLKGLAHREENGVIFTRQLFETLRQRELNAVVANVASKTGPQYYPAVAGARTLRPGGSP